MAFTFHADGTFTGGGTTYPQEQGFIDSFIDDCSLEKERGWGQILSVTLPEGQSVLQRFQSGCWWIKLYPPAKKKRPTLTRAEAAELLMSGPSGVKEWNERIARDECMPPRVSFDPWNGNGWV